MTVSFLDNFAPREKSPTFILPSPSVGNRSPQLLPEVGAVLPHRLTPAQRESAIRRALTLAVRCEAQAKHARALVAQLKEKA
jgi:hypothetical protein